MSALRRVPSLLAFSLSLFLTVGTTAGATDVNPLTHRQIPGDFNGDGRLDALFQPLTAGGGGYILLQDGMGRLTVQVQRWTPGYLGLDWSARNSVLTTADLNGDTLADVLVQPMNRGKTAAVLLTDPTGQLLQVSQLIPVNYLGLDWSAAGTQPVPGDFDGDRQKELLLQPAQPGLAGGIVHADTAGHLVGVTEALADGVLGRRWNAADVQLYVGDFNGDGRDDLLMQVRAGAPAAAESAYALLLADANGQFIQVNETWNLKDLGADWNPKNHKILIQDANGDGIMDIVVQSTVANGTNYVFTGNSQGAFIEPAAHWTGNKSAAEVLKAQQKAAPNNGISVVVAQPTSNVVMPPSGSSPASPSGSQGVRGSGTLMTVNAAGVVDGAGGVSGGTASYNIPIALPPGIRGMQPSISLGYSSRGGNGEVGMGWSLSAGSQIHRCPATQAMDGRSDGVTYGVFDHLCLDGQHLVLVTGTYGTSGAKYRTELDSFALVSETGDISNASSSFAVTYKNGRQAFYGYGSNIGSSPNAVFTPQGAPAPLAWGIGMEMDTYRNSIIYYYSTFGAGEFLLTSIKYTGNGATTPGNREVDFTYQTRADVSSQYLAGGLTLQTQLLSGITTKENGTLVRTYNLEYNTSADTGRSILAAVQECGGSGASQLCLAPTSFAWSSSALSGGTAGPTFTNATDLGIDIGGGVSKLEDVNPPTLSVAGDFDGDGFRDLTYSNANGTYAVFADGSDQTTDLGAIFGGYTVSYDADLNNDGAADVFGVSHGVYAYAYWKGNGIIGNVTSTGIPLAAHGGYAIPVDVDGDGLTDIVAPVPDPNTSGQFDLVWYQNTGAGQTFIQKGATYPLPTCTGNGQTYYSQPISAGNLDGSGHPDFFISCNNFATNQSMLGVLFTHVASNGVMIFSFISSANLGLDPVAATTTMNIKGGPVGYFVDINGDGLQDYVFACSDGDWCYQLNIGSGANGMFGNTVDTKVQMVMGSAIGTTAQNDAVVGDLYNDGREELVFPSSVLFKYCALRIVGGNDTIDCAGVNGVPDYSIYRYGVVSFSPVADAAQIGGWRYVPQISTPANLVGQAGYAKVADIKGDGLSGLLSPFMALNTASRGYEGPGDTSLSKCPGTTLPCGTGIAFNAASSNTGVNAAPDLMTSATNGFTHYDRWDYYPLSSKVQFNGHYLYQVPDVTDPNRYAGGDYFYFSSSMYVVGDYVASNGAGSANTHDFHYAQAIYNNQGRGFQGFRTVVDDDMATGARTVQFYHQRFPLSGQLQESWTTDQATSFNLADLNPNAPANAVDHVTNTAACFVGSGTRHFVSGTYTVDPTSDPVTCTANKLDAPTYWSFVSQSQEHKQDTAGNRLSDTTESYTYDLYGNATEVDSTVLDDFGTYTNTVVNSFDTPDTVSWWLDKLLSKTVTVHALYNNTPDPGAVARETTYGNYNAQRLPRTVTNLANWPGDDQLITQYVYDGYGNPQTVTLSGGSGATVIASRTTTTDYPTTGADAGYFPITVTNPLHQITHMTNDARFGEPSTVTDPNNVVTTYTYDVFGRKITSQVTSPQPLPAQNIQYVTSSGSQDPNCGLTSAMTQYYVLITQDGTPTRFTCYDMLNRVLRTGVEGFAIQSDDVYRDTNLDPLGRVTGTTEPYYHNASAPVIWNLNSYYPDILGRLENRTDAKGVVTNYGYNGLVTTVTTTTPCTASCTAAQGDIKDNSYSRVDVETKNILGKTMRVTNAQGDATQAATVFTYDSDGNPLTITAADNSVITAHYNVLNQKTEVDDPDQGTTTYSYDVLGELLQQTDAKAQTQTMAYDLLGRMRSRTAPEGTTTWCYDTAPNADGTCPLTGLDPNQVNTIPYAGKQSNVLQFDGYQETYVYDPLSRPSKDIETIGGSPYETDTSYDSDGRVDTVTYPASIADAVPVASAGSTQYAAPNTAVTLSGSATDADSGPQPLNYQWSQTAGPAVSLSSPTAATTTFTTGSTPGTNYSFQMVADDGLAASPPASVTVSVPPLPAAPVTLTDSGDNGNATGDTVAHDGIYVVVWTAVSVPHATIVYHLEEAGGTASGPTTGYTEIAATGSTSVTVHHPGNGYYYYYYRVRVEDKVNGSSVGFSPYSAIDSIHVVVAPGAPTTLNPSGLTGTTGPRVIFTWSTYTGALPAADVYYQLLDSASNTFSPQSVVYSGTALTYDMFVGTGAGDIYFHARACNTNGGVTVCSGYTPSCHLIIAGGGSGNAPVNGGTTTAPAPTTNTGPTGSLLPDSLQSPLPQLEEGQDRTRKIGTVLAFATPRARHRGVRSTYAPPVYDVQGGTNAAGDMKSGAAKAWADVSPTYASPVYQAWRDLKLQPASGSTNLVGFSVQYQYTVNGYLWKLASGANPNRVYWSENVFAGGAGATDAAGNFYEHGMDARGNVTDAIYGGGKVNTHFGYDPNTGYLASANSTNGGTTYQNLCYTWQAIGNLVKRAIGSGTCTSATMNEQFGYDLQNRLISSQVTNASGAQTAVTYAYDSVGDITCKSDVVGGTCSPGSTGYGYGGNGAGPHAVTSTAGTVNGSYAYDANGNMTCRSYTGTCSPLTPNITWDSDNMVTGVSSPSGSSAFNYAPDKHRYKQVATSAAGTETTLYVGGLEIVTDTTGAVQYRNTISAYGRPVMMDTLSTDTTGTPVEAKHYLLTDHLGSVDTVVDDSANVAPQESFDAFGKRRDPAAWVGPAAATDVANARKVTHRGFTHHEHLDNLMVTDSNNNTIDGLVDANGRMLDPVSGRFVSVDPVYQAPTNSQSVNPYSYVMNNPLSLVDPSGYEAACTKDSADSNTTCTSTQQTSATDIGSHIAHHGETTTTTTINSSGRIVDQTAKGNGAGLGEVSVISSDSDNGATHGMTGTTQSGGNTAGSSGQLDLNQRANVSTSAGSGSENSGGGNVSLQQPSATSVVNGSQNLSEETLKKLGLPTDLQITATQLVAAVIAQEFRGQGDTAVQAGTIAFVNRMIEAQNGTNWGQQDGVSQPGLKDNLMLQLISAPNQFTALSINPTRIGKILAGTVDSSEYSGALQKLSTYNDGKTTLQTFRQIWSGKTMLYDIGGRDQWRANTPKHQLRDNSLIIKGTDFFNED